MSTWDYIITYSSVLSPLLPILFFRRWNQKYLYAISAFILVSFLSDIISITVLRGQPNYNFLKLYGWVETVLLILFYHYVFNKSKVLLLYIGGAISVIYFYVSFNVEVQQFNALGRSFESILMIVLSLILLYQIFKNEDDIFIDKSAIFWINIGILLYFSGALFSFILSNYILDTTVKATWILHNSSNVLKNAILAVGLWKAIRN